MKSYVDHEYQWSLLSVLYSIKQHSRRSIANVVHGVGFASSGLFCFGCDL